MIYQKTLPESHPIGSTIVTIVAHDRDADVNAQVTYEIDDRSSTFAIDPRTGEVVLKKPLDYEKVRSYQLTVTGMSFRLSATPRHLPSLVLCSAR